MAGTDSENTAAADEGERTGVEWVSASSAAPGWMRPQRWSGPGASEGRLRLRR